ncbi:binding protein [[Candida] boidinii]|nr:binding protein [[Candida] boidinii]GMF97863.1 unnamed protein product [[Candida] boidinii]
MSQETSVENFEQLIPLLDDLNLSSKLKIRMNAIIEIELFLKQQLSKDRSDESILTDSDLKILNTVFLKQYCKYNEDSKFRYIFRNSLLTLSRFRKGKNFQNLTAYILQVSQRKISVTDLLVLIEWIGSLSVDLAMRIDSFKEDTEFVNTQFKNIIVSSVQILENCFGIDQQSKSSDKQPQRQRRILTNAKAHIKYIFVQCLPKYYNLIDLIIDTIINDTSLKTKNLSSCLTHLGLLSESINSISLASRPQCFETFDKSKSKIFDFYVKDVLLTKNTIIQFNSLTTFNSFIVEFADESIFKELILPNLEKAALRNSELIFSLVTPNLLNNTLKFKIDLLSIISSSKFLNSLISSLKSSKESVRIGSSISLCNLLNSIDYSITKNESLLTFTNELLKSLKTVTASSIDIKLLFSNVLSNINSNNETVLLNLINSLVLLVGKDSNELSLESLLTVYFNDILKYLSLNESNSLDTKILDSIKKGLQDSKQNLRKCWSTTFVQSLIDLRKLSTNSNVTTLIKNTLPFFSKSLDECVASPLPSVSNKLISAAYSAIVLSQFIIEKCSTDEELVSLITDADYFNKSIITSDSKLSIITSPRIYSKLTTESEFNWFSKSLFALSNNFPKNGELSLKTLYGYCWLFGSASNSVNPDSRRSTVKLLCEAYKSNPYFISKSVISAINDHLLPVGSIVSQEDKTTINLDLRHFTQVIIGVTENLDQKNEEFKFELSINLCDLLIASHFNGIHLKNNWIGLVLRSSLDPGRICEIHSKKIVSTLCSILENTELIDSPIYQAACKAISTVSFISPDIITSSLTETLSKSLDISNMVEINEERLSIWKGKEGEAVVNVLEKSTKTKQLDKNSKDYETLKWEESVRKQVNTKKTPAKKLTKEEQKLVNDQLELESKIRKEITEEYSRLYSGLQIIIALSNQASTVDNGVKTWFPVAISRIMNILQSGNCTKLLGQLPTDCFIAMSKAIPRQQLGSSTAEYFAATTLRVYNIPVDIHSYEPLEEVLYSVLFSLSIACKKTALDPISLMFILPALVKTLETSMVYLRKNKKPLVQAKTEFVNEAKEEEEISFILEIISSNPESFQDESIPRTEIIRQLLTLMSFPSKAKPAKECFLALCQNIAVTISDSDLAIILASCIDSNQFVRTATLEALDEEFVFQNMTYSSELWIAVHDNVDTNAEVASTIWNENDFTLDESVPSQLLNFIGVKDHGIRLSVATAIASAISELDSPELFASELHELLQLYRIKEKPPAPILDEFGLVIKASTDQKDTWEERSGVALTLKHLAPLFKDSEHVKEVFEFLVFEKALGDKEPTVRHELQDAGVEIINKNGSNNVETLMPILKQGLIDKDDGTKVQDKIKESVIILYGSLARHLDSTDPRIKEIIDRLIVALSTPSENVQFAISECLAPLISMIKLKPNKYLDDLFEKLFTAKTLAQRRGAAYGISGIVKGCGIKSLAENDIMRNIIDAADDKKDAKKREGVMFSLECLSQSLGPFFEPYVIEVLPIILRSFGDQTAEVREATDFAARVVMKNTTSYGVKKLIPLAIQNLDDIAWRSKKGSVELLGSMAYLDPTQLSSSLPKIVPEIVKVLNDSHKEVRKAADQALKKFGDVIRNPEIQKLVPILLNAIGDPANHTNEALDSLIATQFVHYIDGPSLAIIIHVIDRGMQDRSATTKRKCCQIVGNMSILVDSKDLIPYLPSLIAQLEGAMVDPVPATRATAARALGSLVEKLGEERMPDLIPRLLATLEDPTRAGDRLGSAQSLAEIVSGIGLSKLDELLPLILKNCTNPRAFIRAGFMPMLLFLPVCFGSQFSPYLSKIIPPILSGLADADEEIRETSLRAGRLIVNNYAKKAVDILLPQLEIGLSDPNPRIRLSSVELTGDLLFKISGISGKQELSEDLTTIAKSVDKAFNEALGAERRDRVLASLFVCRSDTAGVVRNAAINIWKALVANTPKTVKEILPTLTQIIVRRLASPDEDQRKIAATTLGEMVRRVGSDAWSQLLPTLEESFLSSDSDAKQGICIAVRELVESASTENVHKYQDRFVAIIRDALVDANESVRESAAQAFDVLQDAIGDSAVDEVIPQLLEMLDSDSSDDALSALQEIMSTKSDIIFPILIPSLLTPPIKARALSALAQVAGPALFKRLSTIINSLTDSIINEDGVRSELLQALTNVLLSVDSDDGCHPLLQQILSLVRHEDSKRVAVIYEVLPQFFNSTVIDYSVYTHDIVTSCIMALDNEDKEIAKNSFETLSVLVKKQSKESLEKLVRPAQQSLSFVGKPGQDLYVFTLPKGPNCLLPIFLHGLMYGTSDQRELSAKGITDIVERTPAAALKPFVTVIAGPLIRVIGERFSSDVKSSILLALNKLFAKVPQFLRPFIPQLQRTFVKSLSDPSNELLRSRAARALGTLIEYQPRVDPLVMELLGGAKATTDIGVKTAMLKALLEVVDKAGTKMNESSKNGVMELIEKEMFSGEVGVDTAVAYARLIGALSKILSDDEAIKMLKLKVFDIDLQDSNSSRFAILTLNAFLKDSPEHIFKTGLFSETTSFLVRSSEALTPYVSDYSTIAIGKLLLNLGKYDLSDDMEPSLKELIGQLCKLTGKPVSNSLDTRRLSLVVIRTICRFEFEKCVSNYLDLLVPSVFQCVRDPIIPIKLAAEKCFLAIFDLVTDEQATVYNKWVDSHSGESNITAPNGASLQIRSITEFTKRIAFRLASVERERITEGGDKEAMFSDQFEDEREIWAVGSVDIAQE